MWSFAWLFVLEAVAITAANAATIVIFTRTRRLHSKQYIMIISQALADLFVGLVSVPMFAAWRVKWQGDRNGLFFTAFLIGDGYFGIASLFGLAALAVERAHATYFPFRHSTLGKGPYIVGIVLMWITPFIVTGPVMFSVEKWIRDCIKMVFISFTLAIICAAYFLIVLKVRCTTTQAHDVNIQENKRLTVTLAVVTFLSLVMWLPFQYLAVVGFKSASPFIYYSAKFLHYGNSLVNSVVYAFRMREMKKEILRVFRVFQCCRSNQISTRQERDPRDSSANVTNEMN